MTPHQDTPAGASRVVVVCVVLLGLALGCSRSTPTKPTETVRVAAIQFSDVDADEVESDCDPEDRNCALEALVREAAEEGAALVVLPEYALNQPDAEELPSNKGASPHPARAPIAARFARLAKELRIFLIINLLTESRGTQRNTQLVFDQRGGVLAWHHKFELFAREKEHLESGDSVTVFETPFGRVGLLICADLYGTPRKHRRLTRELGAQIVAVSTYWTATHAHRWPAAFARDWSVYVVASNAGSGESAGSGVYAPNGTAVATSGNDDWGVVLADIPIHQ